jgi:hypothetical protein
VSRYNVSYTKSRGLADYGAVHRSSQADAGIGTPILELDLELGGALYGVSRLMIQLRLNVTAAPDREPLAGRAAFASIQRRQSPGR